MLKIIKFGGAALRDCKAIQHAAEIVADLCREKSKIVVVVSAMEHETNRLSRLAEGLGCQGTHLDVVLSAGENAATGLMAGALEKQGLRAQTFQGWQVPLLTTNDHGQAKLVDCNPVALRQALEAGRVPVVAGFQGVTALGEVTTFGRGGSDLTAVALGAALEAEGVYFYKDVDLRVADPKIIPNAAKIQSLSLDDLFEQSSQGAKVLHPRALEMARARKLPLHFRNFKTAFNGVETVISPADENRCAVAEEPILSGMVINDQEILVQVALKNHGLGTLGSFFKVLADHKINSDMLIGQNASGAFSNNRINDHEECYMLLLRKVSVQQMKALESDLLKAGLIKYFRTQDKIAKLSLIGSGLRQHPEIIARVIEITASLGVHLYAIVSSEIKITLLLSQSYAKRLAQVLHHEFFTSTTEKKAS